MAKSPKILAKIQHGLTVHKINIPLRAKLGFSNSPFSVKIPVNQAKFTPFTHKSHELREFCTKIHPLYINAFRCLTIGRELSEIPANQPDFAHFPTALVNYMKCAPL